MGKVELKIAIDAELLARAEAAGVSVERFLDSKLRAALAAAPGVSESGPALAQLSAEEKAAQWARESAKTIKAHNRFVEEFGEFGREWRSW